VTRIERWIANPYEIFAKDILKLEPMKELGTEPDAAMRGQLVHRALHEFFGENPERLPAEIEEALIRVADRHFDKLAGSPLVKAFWRPNFQRFARWFAATEPGRRAGITRILTELDGALDLGSFSLTVRADRIDVADDGSVVIYDYKTGRPPLQTHVENLFAPQLPLEAAIAAGGGFPTLGPRAVRDIRYINASGRDDGGEDRAAGKAPASSLAEEALDQLKGLIAQYNNPDMPYAVKRRSAAAFATHYRYDPYEHLARVKEWLTQEADEEFG
jgi:ATP-dependent helicase/nuclease subunit B